MTEKKRQEIRNWLKERKEIYEKYAKELGAELNCELPSRWMVQDADTQKWIPLVESPLMNTDTARGLIANHAYYQGAVDAIYGSGILIA